MSANANGIAQVQQLKQLESTLSDHILFHVDLKALSGALQVRETGLAHEAHRNDSSRDADFPLVGLQIGAGSLAKLGGQLRDRIAPAKFVRVCLQAKGLNLFELFLTLLKLFARLKLQRKILST